MTARVSMADRIRAGQTWVRRSDGTVWVVHSPRRQHSGWALMRPEGAPKGKGGLLVSFRDLQDKWEQRT